MINYFSAFNNGCTFAANISSFTLPSKVADEDARGRKKKVAKKKKEGGYSSHDEERNAVLQEEDECKNT